jgi:hypothetical protein
MSSASTVLLGSLLLLLAQAHPSQGLALDSNQNAAHQRRLRVAAEPDLQYTVTMPVLTSPTSGVKVPLTIPNYLGKQPGAPSPIQPKQMQHRANCDSSRPTFVLAAGEQAAASCHV